LEHTEQEIRIHSADVTLSGAAQPGSCCQITQQLRDNPTTSWSHTRFQALLESTEFCGLQLIDSKSDGESLWILIEIVGDYVRPQSQNRLHPDRFRHDHLASVTARGLLDRIPQAG